MGDKWEALREAAQRAKDAGLSHGQDVLDLLAERDALAAEAERLSKWDKRQEAMVAELGSLSMDLERERDEARAERDALSLDLADVSQALDQADGEADRLVAERDEARAEVAALREEVERLRQAEADWEAHDARPCPGDQHCDMHCPGGE